MKKLLEDDVQYNTIRIDAGCVWKHWQLRNNVLLTSGTEKAMCTSFKYSTVYDLTKAELFKTICA